MEKENKDDENKVKGMSTGKKLLLLFFSCIIIAFIFFWWLSNKIKNNKKIEYKRDRLPFTFKFS